MFVAIYTAKPANICISFMSPESSLWATFFFVADNVGLSFFSLSRIVMFRKPSKRIQSHRRIKQILALIWHVKVILGQTF